MLNEQFKISMPCKYSDPDKDMMVYTIWTNKTLTPDYLFKQVMDPTVNDPALLQIQVSLDNAILKYKHLRSDKANEPIPEITSSFSFYPMPLDRLFVGMDIMSVYGSYFFIMGPLMFFMFLMQEISMEKEKKLRQGLTVVGVSHITYWMNWVIIGTILNLL